MPGGIPPDSSTTYSTLATTRKPGRSSKSWPASRKTCLVLGKYYTDFQPLSLEAQQAMLSQELKAKPPADPGQPEIDHRSAPCHSAHATPRRANCPAQFPDRSCERPHPCFARFAQRRRLAGKRHFRQQHLRITWPGSRSSFHPCRSHPGTQQRHQISPG